MEVIANADAPNVFQYRVDIGSGQTISTDYSGGYSVIDKTGEQVVSLGAPWATDSEGVDVPTRYNMVDDVLTLEVNHQNSGVNYAYPILADPCWKFLSEGCKKKVAKDAMGSLITARTSVLVAIAATAASGGTAAPVTLSYALGATVIGTVGGAVW